MDPYFLMTEIKKAGVLPGYIVANALNARHFGNHYNLAKLGTNKDYAIHSILRLLQRMGEWRRANEVIGHAEQLLAQIIGKEYYKTHIIFGKILCCNIFIS